MAGNIVEDALAELETFDAGSQAGDTPQATQEAPEAPAVSEKPRYRLEDVILDDPSLPESLRGKPAAELAADRIRYVQQVQDIGYQKNAAIERAQIYEAALDILKRQQPAREEPPPQRLRPSEQLRRSGADPDELYQSPDRIVDGTVDVAEQRIMPRVQEAIAPIEQELQQLRAERQQSAIYNAGLIAAAQMGISQKDWVDVWAPMVTSPAVASRKPLTDPQTYVEAVQFVRSNGSRLFGGGAAPPPPAPAPPTGGGRTAAVQPRAVSGLTALKPENRKVFEELSDVFGFDEKQREEVYKDTRTHRTTRRAFE